MAIANILTSGRFRQSVKRWSRAVITEKSLTERLKENAMIDHDTTFKSKDLFGANFVQIGQEIREILAFEMFGTK